MRNPRLLALVALLCAGAAAPAFAAWDRVGTVDFTRRDNTDVQYGNFGGPVEALSLRATNKDVTCRDVTAVFGNGNSRNVFHGQLPRGRDITVDLPGNGRRIERLEFNCRSDGRGAAHVDIAADIGRYQAEWRRSPDWDRMWSRMFHWDDRNRNGGDRYITGQLDTSNWITVSSERFDNRRDHEVATPGRDGRGVDAIALRPVDGDARCDYVRIHFGNGSVQSVQLDRVLPRNRVTSIDLPGDRRNVTRVGIVCKPERGPSVTMQVLASR